MWDKTAPPGGSPATPAFVTVREVLADVEFVQYNQTTAAVNIQALRDAILAAQPALTTVGLPALFVGKTDLTGSGYAYVPDLVNLQPGMAVGGGPLAPKPFAPDRNATTFDLFERTVTQLLPSIRFVDEWAWYHDRNGEVHCGTATLREAPETPWWSMGQ